MIKMTSASVYPWTLDKKKQLVLITFQSSHYILTWWSSFKTQRPHFLQWCARGALKPSQTSPKQAKIDNRKTKFEFIFTIL